jgi:hypothetical protein
LLSQLVPFSRLPPALTPQTGGETDRISDIPPALTAPTRGSQLRLEHRRQNQLTRLPVIGGSHSHLARTADSQHHDGPLTGNRNTIWRDLIGSYKLLPIEVRLSGVCLYSSIGTPTLAKLYATGTI